MSSSKQDILMDDNYDVIEEQVVTTDGGIAVKKYAKGKFLGKGGFAKCYEVTDVVSKKVFAAKIIDKATLSKHRAKQKVNF